MVYDPQHLCPFDAVDRLTHLVVIHQYHLFTMYIEQSSSRNQSEIHPVLVDHREVVESVGLHHFLDVLERVCQLESHQIFVCHAEADRDTLVDEPRCREGIVRRADDDAVSVFRQLFYRFRRRRSLAHYQTFRPQLYCREVRLETVSGHYQVILLYEALHYIRTGSRDRHLALFKHFVVVAAYYPAVKCLCDARKSRSGCRQHMAVAFVHI